MFNEKAATLSVAGLSVIILCQSCLAFPNCKTEKAINHMRKIQNVDSYVYNDTHLLNINNKGIKILNRDVTAYYAINRDQVEFIYLMYNNLNEVDAGAFEEFENVRNINFGVNLLETIKRNYFRGTKKIDFLNFQSNLIQTIEAGSFDDLKKLQFVYLNDNCLTQVPEHLFSHTVSIRNVFLQQNRLVNLPDNFMRPSQKLFGLNVAENRLQDISDLFLFKNLLSLIASNNKLDPIEWNSVEGCEMTSLNVDNTTILDVNFVRKLKRLRELYAAHNQIRSFDVEEISGSRELSYISLQSNPLESIKIEAVDVIFPNLRVLDISKTSVETDCRRLLELFRLVSNKSLNLNIDAQILSGCLQI